MDKRITFAVTVPEQEYRVECTLPGPTYDSWEQQVALEHLFNMLARDRIEVINITDLSVEDV